MELSGGHAGTGSPDRGSLFFAAILAEPVRDTDGLERVELLNSGSVRPRGSRQVLESFVILIIERSSALKSSFTTRKSMANLTS